VVWEGRSREAPPYPDRSDFVLLAPNGPTRPVSRCPLIGVDRKRPADD
jgi:hypothetical protein